LASWAPRWPASTPCPASSRAVYRFGTPEQQARWLPPIVDGRLTVAEALTEPRGGSDFFGTSTQARRDGDSYLLDGQKRFVVGAEGAELVPGLCRTDPQAKPHQA